MLVGKHKPLKRETEGFQLKSPNSVNLLGITIGHNLAFDSHVSNIWNTAGAKVKRLSGIRNALDEKQAELLYNTFILPQFNYCSIIWMFCGKTGGFQIAYNKPHMSLEKLLIHDESISVPQKHIYIYIYIYIYTSLTRLYTTFSGENTYVMKKIVTKKRIFKQKKEHFLLTLPKINTKKFGFYSFSFLVSHLWNQLHDQINTKQQILRIN